MWDGAMWNVGWCDVECGRVMWNMCFEMWWWEADCGVMSYVEYGCPR